MADSSVNGVKELAAIDYDDIDVDSIHLPPGEDVGIPSDDESLYWDDELKMDTGSGNVVIVDNLPVVPPEKFEKLVGVIGNHFSRNIGVIKEGGLSMPVDPESGKTLGYCFIEYNTAQEAELAKKEKNGQKLDRHHTFAVYTFEEFDRLMRVSDQWAPPETKPYTPGENLQRWLADQKARDQFVIRAGSDTEVFWNDSRWLKPEPVYKHTFPVEGFVQWSPLGTYLAIVDNQGAQLWGGASTFNRLVHYSHPQDKLIDFSPGEKYFVTYSSQEPRSPRDPQGVVINIHETRTGKVVKDFKGSADDFPIGAGPVFRWCSGKDDKYFARIGKNVISVYETETFDLIDRKSLRVDNVVDFTWSPTDPILALFVPELSGGNQPARVSLVQIPGKEELRQKNLFGISDCKMYWQNNGDYLAVKIDRYTKNKKSTYTGFELFRIRDRDIPIEVLELEDKTDKVIAFAWEPKGHRFAVIHGDDPRPDVSFYTMKSGDNTVRVTKLITLKGRQADAIFWSPGGKYIVLAGLKNFNGQLEFYNVDELQTMACTEHFLATNVEWDPSGRYVATAVSSAHRDMENGFHIWTFYGKLLYRVPKDLLCQFSWRPRPPPILSPEKEEEIERNLKEYSKKYEAEDQDVSLQLSEQDREKRRVLRAEWDAWVSRWRQLYEDEEPEMQKLMGGEASDKEEDGECEAKEVEVEVLLGVSEEVLSD